MTATSTLDGYQPEVGDIVWQQLYSPVHPAHDSTLLERIEHGELYGPRRLMIVRGVAHDDNFGTVEQPHFVTCYALQAADPKDRRGECHGYSWCESDWCVLELVERPARQLDLLALAGA